jgi:hypothetical protein
MVSIRQRRSITGILNTVYRRTTSNVEYNYSVMSVALLGTVGRYHLHELHQVNPNVWTSIQTGCPQQESELYAGQLVWQQHPLVPARRIWDYDQIEWGSSTSPDINRKRCMDPRGTRRQASLRVTSTVSLLFSLNSLTSSDSKLISEQRILR